MEKNDGEWSADQMNLRPCTSGDFKGVEDELINLKRGVENSVFCPDDLSKLELYNHAFNET